MPTLRRLRNVLKIVDIVLCSMAVSSRREKVDVDVQLDAGVQDQLDQFRTSRWSFIGEVKLIRLWSYSKRLLKSPPLIKKCRRSGYDSPELYKMLWHTKSSGLSATFASR